MSGKFGLVGVMGLADNMSKTLRQAASAARGLRAEVQHVDRSLKALAGRPVNIRVNVTGNAVAEVQRIEQRLSRVGRGIMFRTNGGQSRAAAALLDSNGAQQVARTGRVIQMEQARAAREQDRINKAQEQAESILSRKRAKEQADFERRAQSFLARREKAELVAARHTAMHTSVMPMPSVQNYQYTRNPVVRWLQTQMAQADVASARSSLDAAAKSAPRFVEMARAGLSPAHLHGDAMKKRWVEIQGMAHREKSAMDRLKAASQGAVVGGVNIGKVLGKFIPSAETWQSVERGFTRTVRNMAGTVKTVFGGITSVITAPFRMLNSIGGLLGIAGGAYGAKQLLGTALGFSSDMEQAQISYETMLKSASKAKAFLGQQWTFAAKTPFTFQETLENSRRLLAYGFKTEGASDWRSVMPWMTQIGNAVSSLGTGQEGFQRLSIAIGQVQAKGRLMGEEIRQLTETGIPVVEILAQKLGKTQEQIMKGADAGIMAEEALKALYQGLADRYGGGMAKQARTLAGLWTTVKDNFLMMLGGLGDGMRSVIQPALSKITDWFERNPMDAEIWRNRLMSIGLRATKGLTDAFTGAVKRLDVLFGTAEFQNASLFGKAKLIWDDLIAKPFADWWASTGKEKVTKTAGELGGFVGDTIAGAVQKAFGIDVGNGSMAGAGLTAGQAFVDGFIQAIDRVDWGAVFGNAFKQHPVMTAGATLGGANVLTGGLVGVGLGGLLKWGGRSLWRWIFPSATTAAGETAGTAATATGAAAAGKAGSMLARVNPYAVMAALLLEKGRQVYSYGGGFEERIGSDLRAQYGDAAVNRSKWMVGIPSRLGPGWTGLSDWMVKQSLFAQDLWGLTDRPQPEPIPEATAFPMTSRQDVNISVQVVRSPNEDDDSLADKIGKAIMYKWQAQLSNS